ncbi:CoA transferase [Segeticoccus rhizosphaerae]|jgi:crotonobetainyl-CoA:carnitine CoA-transferase CaiB-like acyl-CoA transferase|uniref:CoA transferase n=1 Tax=Segeticoccus rhizosphaerae TaxID=1104777 RepID=UPI0010C01B80|nr:MULTISPECIES: CoA transferase [Intrasporangiaceae]
MAVRAVEAAAVAASRLAELRGAPLRFEVDPVLTAASFDSIGHLRVDGRAPEPFAPLSGYFQTSDGWVRLHGNYPHHRAALADVLGTDDRDAVADRLRERSAQEVEQSVRAAGGIAAALRTLEQWRAHPQGEAVAGVPLVEVDEAEGAVPLSPADGLPMSGLRVLDLTRVIAGPTATRLLGALGADVLRLDPPALPELLDQHLDTGFAKRTGTADLADAAVSARVDELLHEADVLVTGYRPGALARFGLDARAVGERHPHLVRVEFCAWGFDGPWADQRGFDSVVQSAVGIGHAYGAEVDGVWRPGALPAQALDHATGYLVAAEVMNLLARRHETGPGAARLSLARTAHWLTTLRAAELPSQPDGSGEPVRLTSHSPYGLLTYVPLPLRVHGEPLDYPSPPGRYGEAELTWLTVPAPTDSGSGVPPR